MTRWRDYLGALSFILFDWGSIIIILLLLWGSIIMTKMLIDHVSVDIGIRLKSTAVSRIAETISLFGLVFSLLCSFLAYLFNLFYLIFSLEIFGLDVFNTVFILEPQSVKLFHIHLHYVTSSVWVNDHLAQIMGKLVYLATGFHRQTFKDSICIILLDCLVIFEFLHSSLEVC